MSSSTGGPQASGQPGGSGSSGGSAVPGSPSTGPGGPAPRSTAPKLPGDPLPSDGERTVRGQVVAGVEAGCLLLNAGGVDYLLLGGDPKVVYAGATVAVRGTVARGVMTTCMQGVPFQVAEAHPA